MRFVIGLVLFVIAFVVSAFASLFAMGAVAGPDIGFAGAGLWFVMAPAALIGTLLAYPLSHKLGGEGVGTRRIVFLLAAPPLSGLLAAMPLAAYKSYSRVDITQPDPAYAYMLSDAQSVLEIKVDRYAAFGKPTPISIERNLGSWQKVPAGKVPAGRRYFSQPIDGKDPGLLGNVTFEWEPRECMSLVEVDAATGEAKAVFHDLNNMGRCDIRATLRDLVYDRTITIGPVTVNALRK